jgi:SAM-dependent methyltransferase
MSIDIFKKQFGNEALNYTKYRMPYPESLYALLFSLVPKDGKKILDLACGTGKSTEDLVKTGLDIFGCDHDPLMIEEAKRQAVLKNLDIHYSVASSESLPFEDNTFDVVTVGTAFHFFMNDSAMSEIKRILKPNGLLFIFWTLTTKEIPEENEIPGSIYRKYNWIRIPSELRDLDVVSSFLHSMGFIDISTKRIPFSYQTTVEERVGLQTTSGMYEILSPEDKQSFLSDVESVLQEKLGQRQYFVLEEEVQVCFGLNTKK